MESRITWHKHEGQWHQVQHDTNTKDSGIKYITTQTPRIVASSITPLYDTMPKDTLPKRQLAKMTLCRKIFSNATLCQIFCFYRFFFSPVRKYATVWLYVKSNIITYNCRFLNDYLRGLAMNIKYWVSWCYYIPMCLSFQCAFWIYEYYWVMYT